MLDNLIAASDWKIQIYRVQSECRQRRILSAFQRIARPGVIALGTRSGPDWFVVVESCSYATEIHARRVVVTIDPTATRTYECEAPPAGPLPGLRTAVSDAGP